MHEFNWKILSLPVEFSSSDKEIIWIGTSNKNISAQYIRREYHKSRVETHPWGVKLTPE